MPIYEYKCQSCDHELEALQKISDAPLRDCPACGQGALKKKISAAAFRLKGGGWYETDFKTGKKKNVAGDQPASDNGGANSGKDSAGKDSAGKNAKESSGAAKADTATSSKAASGGTG